MKKWYQENFVSRRNWILENIRNLNINPQQALILLLIDYDNECRESITVALLSQQANISESETDRLIMELVQLNYLKIAQKNRRIYYDISSVFEEKPKVEVNGDVFSLFESEFGRPLSQKETTMIAGWMQNYSSRDIIKALREAIKYGKTSTDYIDRILVSNKDRQD